VNRKSLSIHAAALKEAELAIEWYRERSPRAAPRFLDELDRIIERVLQNTAQFPEYEFGTRRAFFHRFPYFVVFREKSKIEVIAIVHGRRRPRYWEARVQ
jgi:plasmid stabilization system protein ParE